MKTKEELAALKKEVEALNAKLAGLSEEELAQVVGGMINPFYDGNKAVSGGTILHNVPQKKDDEECVRVIFTK